MEPSHAAHDTARLLLWGVPELHLGGRVVPFGRERRYQLLVLLALHDGHWVGRDRASALLWSGHTVADARRNLRKVIHQAREVPGAEGLEATDHAMRWVVDTDRQAFRRAVECGDIDAALVLRRGALVEGFDDPANAALSDWLAAERARADQAWRAAAAASLRGAADSAAQLRLAQRMLDVDALDETALAALVTALSVLGRPVEAVAAYTRYAERLQVELGVEPSSALRDLARNMTLAPRALAATTARGPAPVAAPRPHDFVGRRAELAELEALLSRSECRLLTLLGPGGIGKSRLARQAIAPLSIQFPGAAMWVELQDLTDTEAVPARLAQCLGIVGVEGGDPLPRLCRALPEGRTLWVLDNAEHLAELPQLLERLLAGAASLTLLVTSRRRLRIAGEWVMPLPGLAVPDEDSRDLEAAGSFDAVRLFEARARAAVPDFMLARHVDAVVSIVDLVAGMPLAIELAAAWVRLLPPARILADLQASLDLLERDPGDPSRPARPDHASLRKVLERSWSMLGPSEREAAAALAVFHGGFTHEAARAVAGCPLPLLSALVDKSIVAVDHGGRFGLHPVVMVFAAEQLAGSPKRASDLRRRHAEHFARHFSGLARHAVGDPRALVAEVSAEFANAIVAWRCALELRRCDWIAAMVRALWAYLENRGRQREGIELLTPALALADDAPEARLAQARLHHGLSMLHHRIGHHARSLELARNGARVAADGVDTEAWIGCHLNASSCLWAVGDPEAALECIERGIEIARARNDAQCLAWALGNLGLALCGAGRFDEAEASLLQALEGSRAMGDHYNVTVHLINLGGLARDRDDPAELEAAVRWYRQALEHARRHDIDFFALHSAVSLANVHYLAHQFDETRRHFEDSLLPARRNGHQRIVEAIHLGLARLDLAAGDWKAARQVLAELLATERLHLHANPVAELVLEHAAGLVAGGEGAAAAQAYSSVLGFPTVVGSLRQLAQSALAALPPQVRDFAGPAITIDKVVSRLLNGR